MIALSKLHKTTQHNHSINKDFRIWGISGDPQSQGDFIEIVYHSYIWRSYIEIFVDIRALLWISKLGRVSAEFSTSADLQI